VDVAVQPHRTLPQLAENRVIVSTSPSIIQLLVKDVPDCLLQQKHSGKDYTSMLPLWQVNNSERYAKSCWTQGTYFILFVNLMPQMNAPYNQ